MELNTETQPNNLKRPRGRPNSIHTLTEKLPSTTERSADGLYSIYTYYTKDTRGDGSVVYRKQTQRRKLIKKQYEGGVVPRRKRITPQRIFREKKIFVKNLADKILNSDIDINRLKSLYGLLNLDPK